MYYIRFLKSPQVHVKKGRTRIRALVTVTTDLGESFYAEPCQLYAVVLASDQRALCTWSSMQWQPHMRAAWVETSSTTSTTSQQEGTLLVSSSKLTGADVLGQDCSILSARCRIPSPSQTEPTRLVQRNFQTTNVQLSLFEEMGESIARHVWYAVDPRDAGFGGGNRPAHIDLGTHRLV